MISIVIPSFNGSATLRSELPAFIEFLKTKNISYEIIIVDDGSEDQGTTEKFASQSGCIFIGNKKNMGKGASIKRGMLAAKGDFRIFTDVDIPFQFDSFEKFLYYLDFKEFDVVVGDRTLPGSNYFKEISFLRKTGSNVFSFIAGRFVAGGFFDTQCGMKGFRASVAEDIFSVTKINGFAFDVEVLYIALKRNYDIKRLPVILRCNETSSVNVIKHGLIMLKDVFSIPVNNFFKKYKKIK